MCKALFSVLELLNYLILTAILWNRYYYANPHSIDEKTKTREIM